jgi:hypothetical protein
LRDRLPISWTNLCGIRLQLDSTETEPIELIGAQSQQIWQVPDAGKKVSAEHLDRYMPLMHLQIQLDRLRRAGKVIHDQHFFFAEAPYISEDPMI